MPASSTIQRHSAAQRPRFARYALAVALSLCALLVMLALDQLVGYGMFQLAVVAVVLSAWYGGLWSGLLTAMLCGLSVLYFFLPPRNTLEIPPWEQGLQLVVFSVVAILMSSLSETRYRAEATLRRRSEELQAANQELEAFSYSVSHDLRWPLRAIDGYAKILLDEYGVQLDERGKRYIENIRKNTQHMDALVQDLLAFSRLSREPLHRKTVDPGELVEEALSELQFMREDRKIDIAIGAMPPCEADPRLFKQVFLNLLQNAFKFTRTREVARIEIGSRDADVYYVKDNGVGFDMKYADKVFGVFERLHSAEEYEGTGVGLAIVRRIIERHGGRIWSEAEVEKGATFLFSIGKES